MKLALLILTSGLLTLGIEGCTHAMPSHGTYDAVLPNQTVITLRIERLSNGKVDGSLQGTAVNPATDSIVDMPVQDLEGEIFKANLSLKATNSPEPVTYLGQIQGDTVTLQNGNETTVFRRVDATEHTAYLAAVQQRASGLRDFRSRQKLLAKIHDQVAAQQKELADYVQWEPKFTQDVAGIRHWYAAQQAGYQKCLTSIQAAAAASIPEWRWQECALQVSTASYARQQMLQTISAIERKQIKAANSIDQAISSTPATLAAILAQTKGLLATCKYAADVADCERLFGQASHIDAAQKILLSPQEVASFQDYQATAQLNLATLDSIKSRDATHLQTLATKIGAVYAAAK